MRTLVEVKWPLENQPEDATDTVYEKANYWLLHWGMKMEVINVDGEKLAVGNYTVAICEHYTTGQIECFNPEQLKVLGREINK